MTQHMKHMRMITKSTIISIEIDLIPMNKIICFILVDSFFYAIVHYLKKKILLLRMKFNLLWFNPFSFSTSLFLSSFLLPFLIFLKKTIFFNSIKKSSTYVYIYAIIRTIFTFQPVHYSSFSLFEICCLFLSFHMSLWKFFELAMYPINWKINYKINKRTIFLWFFG